MQASAIELALIAERSRHYAIDFEFKESYIAILVCFTILFKVEKERKISDKNNQKGSLV